MSHERPAQTDSELLMQFATQQDEQAFRDLVARHAPLVMNVCRQISRNEHDAEDAFQATFLILARRAERLPHVASLAGWLHRVASRTALRAGTKRAKHPECQLAEEPPGPQEEVLQAVHSREIQRVLHDALRLLPEHYRNAIVLCDLQGKTRSEAAAHLDCTEASIKAALARGRRQLRFRLLKRGVALSAAITAAAQAIAAQQPAEELVESTWLNCTGQIANHGSRSSAETSVERLTLENVMERISGMPPRALTASLAVVPLAALLTIGPLLLLGQVAGPAPAQSASAGSQPIQLPAATESERESPAAASVAAGAATANGEVSEQKPEPDVGADADVDAEPVVSQSAEKSERLQGLERALIATLRQLVASEQELYQTGRRPVEDLIRARLSLSKAQLAYAKNSRERLQILEDRVQQFELLEKELLAKRGTLSIAEMLKAKAERLEAEIAYTIELQRASSEAATTKPASQPEQELEILGVEVDTAPEPLGLHEYRVDVGDILAIYIPHVLGDDSLPDALASGDKTLLPAVGFPVPVLGDGAIHLPLVAPVSCQGKTLAEVENAIRRAYTIENNIMLPGREMVLVGLVKRRTQATRKKFEERIGVGDTLAIFIDGVLGSRDSPPLIDLPSNPDVGPAIGIPFVVQSDGSVSLPLVGGVSVAGMELAEAHTAIYRAYTVNHRILDPGRDVVMVAMLRKHRR